MEVTVTLNMDKVKARLEKAAEAATVAMATQALKDSNDIARRYSGELVKSSLTKSDLKRGRLIWETPYAREAYYMGTPATGAGHNPKAVLRWAHHASAEKREEWRKLAQQVVDKEAK